MEEKKKTSAGKKSKAQRLAEAKQRKLCTFNIAVLMSVFAFITIFMTFGKRPNVSYEENRDLEKLPEFTLESYWKGAFNEQVGKYYNDTVPMRATWKSVISKFRGILGIKYAGGITIIGDPVINTPTKPATSKPSAESRPETSVPAVVVRPPSETSSDNTSGNTSENASETSGTSSDTSADDKVPPVYVRPPSGG